MRMSTLAAAAMAFAAYKYLKRQRTERAVSLQGMRDEIDQGLTGVGSESPNAAERLQSTGASAGGARTDKWFGSSSQEGSEPISTGLPDLTRGA